MLGAPLATTSRKAPMTSLASARITISMLLWLKPGGTEALARFRERAAPLWKKYDLRVERVLAAMGKGQLVGANEYDVPDVMQLFSVPSLEVFQQYIADPEIQRLSAERDAGVARTVAVIGAPREASTDRPESSSETGARLYGLAFVRFLPGGADGMREFNRRAGPLFVRHGMFIETILDVSKTLTPVGEPLPDFAPECVVLFFLEEPGAMKAYASDPEYRELAPIRDRGLRSYDFFLAKAPAAPAVNAGAR